MSIPQICPSCGNHISTAHAADCCYGTTQYAHLGWPSYQVTKTTTITGTGDGIALMSTRHPLSVEELSGDTWAQDATAIRRLLDYLTDETEEVKPQESGPSEFAFTAHAVFLLTKRSEELRREAAGISLIESRAKRIFAADILENLIQELTE